MIQFIATRARMYFKVRSDHHCFIYKKKETKIHINIHIHIATGIRIILLKQNEHFYLLNIHALSPLHNTIVTINCCSRYWSVRFH